MNRLVIIDDDPSIQLIVENLWEDAGRFTICQATSGAEGYQRVEQIRPDIILLDHLLPDEQGLSLLKRLQALDARVPVIFITASSASHTAIEAMKAGAFDFLTKPLDLDRLQHQIERAIEGRRLMRIPVVIDRDASEENTSSEVLVGQCPAMQAVYKSIGRVAQQNVPVLIQGETGTGKELVARAIYQYGTRASQHFHKVNCIDLDVNWIEAELFGREPNPNGPSGPQRVGKFEQGNGGTLLLEEISGLSLSTQGKLVRVLQEGAFERVGGTKTVTTDVRLIFTTCEDPEELVSHGQLRADLYYLLSAFTIRLPPLRDRGQDLTLLIEHFVNRYHRIEESLRSQVERVSPEALKMLKQYAWPGNIAELQSVLKRALIETRGTIVVSDYLRAALNQQSNQGQVSSPGLRQMSTDWADFVRRRLDDDSESIYAEAIFEMEQHVIKAILQHTGGNQAQAAKRLGITRNSLRKKIQQLGISIQQIVAALDEPSDAG